MPLIKNTLPILMGCLLISFGSVFLYLTIKLWDAF